MVPPAIDSSAQQAAESALYANIQAKGANAYYFAHKKRDTGEEPAPLPVHMPLDTRVIPPPEPIHLITSGYQFLDDGSVVKVYLPMEGLAAAGPEVACSFQARSLSIDVKGWQAGRTVRFAVKELAGAIVPDACTHKVMTNKLLIALAKDGGSGSPAWSKLTAK